MAILGVLLGITMTVLGLLVWQVRVANGRYNEINASHEARITFIEKRKAVVAEAVAGQPKPAGVGAVHSASRVRTWNEDAPYVDKAKN